MKGSLWTRDGCSLGLSVHVIILLSCKVHILPRPKSLTTIKSGSHYDPAPHSRSRNLDPWLGWQCRTRLCLRLRTPQPKKTRTPAPAHTVKSAPSSASGFILSKSTSFHQ
eukprot:3692535-Rhodomonas_salina.1